MTTVGRVLFEQWYDQAGDTAPVRTIEYRYDATGNVLYETDPDSTYTFTYDTLNRLKTVDNAGTPDMPHVVLTYGYDANGNQTSVTDNLGVAVDSTYDPRNRLDTRAWVNTSAQNVVDEVLVNFDYCDCGQISEIDRYTGTTEDVAHLVAKTVYDNHDAAGRVRHIESTTAAGSVLSEYNYQFGPTGLVTHADYTNPAESTHDFAVDYVYDKLGQLTDADFSDATTANGIYTDEFYRYDDRGNRTSSYLHGDGYVTGPGNRLLSDGTFDYAYDNAGNMVRKTELVAGDPTGEVTTYDYDHRNRLTHVTTYSQAPEQGGVILSESSYRYDVQDRRIEIIADDDGAGPNAPQDTWMNYNRDEVWADFDATNTLTARYLYGDKIDQILARFQPGAGTEQWCCLVFDGSAWQRARSSHRRKSGDQSRRLQQFWDSSQRDERLRRGPLFANGTRVRFANVELFHASSVL